MAQTNADAAPVPFALKKDSTALLLIDIQNVNLGPGRPAAPYTVQEVVGVARRLVEAARNGGIKVIAIRAKHEPDEKDRIFPEGSRGFFGAQRSPGWDQVIDGLYDPTHDLLISKRQWGSFYGTDLELQLRRRGINTLLLAGMATNFAVESTARTAWELGFRLIFIEQAINGLDADDHRFALTRIFPIIGRVVQVNDALQLIHAAR